MKLLIYLSLILKKEISTATDWVPPSQYYVHVLHVFQTSTLKCFIIKSYLLPFIIYKTMIIPLLNVFVCVRRGYANKIPHSLYLLYFSIIERLKVFDFYKFILCKCRISIRHLRYSSSVNIVQTFIEQQDLSINHGMLLNMQIQTNNRSI